MSQPANHEIAKPPDHPISTVGVVGAGQMGHGIAHVMLRAGHLVLLLDVSQDFLEAGAKRIAKGLARDVEKERMTAEDREKAITRLKPTTVAAPPLSSHLNCARRSPSARRLTRMM